MDALRVGVTMAAITSQLYTAARPMFTSNFLH